VSEQKQIIVSGSFDDIRSRHLRFLEEASKLGPLTVLLWPDETLRKITGKAPKFPLAERRYFLNTVQFVNRVIALSDPMNPDELPPLLDLQGSVWADDNATASAARKEFCEQRGVVYRVFSENELKGFPPLSPKPSAAGRKKVIVTGCYDWFHSGHVRFFEEASSYGDLYVVVGHDENIQLLKGKGRPLFPEEERRYMVGSIRFVKEALISSGHGWLDAEPEIKRISPDIYLVNEDGDVPEKRDYCRRHGIEYIVLKRVPAPGLPQRSSTALRTT
jgi:cytidyltransferase-like protein